MGPTRLTVVRSSSDKQEKTARRDIACCWLPTLPGRDLTPILRVPRREFPPARLSFFRSDILRTPVSSMRFGSKSKGSDLKKEVVSRAGLQPATHWLKGAFKPMTTSHGSYD